MISITTGLAEVNDSHDQTRPARTRRQLGRILNLIDLLASFRTWKTSHEVTHLVNDRLESTYSQKTIERDLDLLELEGLAESRMESPFQRFSRTEVRTWKLCLESTEALQEAAIKHEEHRGESARVESDPDALYALLIHTDDLGWFESANPPKPLERWSEIVSAFAGRTSALVPVDQVERFLRESALVDQGESLSDNDVLSNDQGDVEEQISQSVSVYTLRYTTPGGRQFFLPESLDLWTGLGLARRLEASGKSPVVYQTEVSGLDITRQGVELPLAELQDLLGEEYDAFLPESDPD